MRKIDREFAVFVHIFKNSGTPVTQQLKAFYGESGVRRENDGQVDGVTFGDRLRKLATEDDVRALCGHFKFVRIHKVLNQIGVNNAKFFSFVRDPVNRALSIYNYARDLESSRLHAMATERTIDDFLEALMQEDSGAITNHQASCLSGDGSRSFEAAQAAITKHFAFVGLSEQLEATNDLARSAFGLAFDGSMRRNVSGNAAAVSDIAPATMQKLRDLNQEDQRLYDYVKTSVQPSFVPAN